MDKISRDLYRLLGVEVTNDEAALYRDHNIIKRPFRSEVIERGIHDGMAIRCPECHMVSWNPNDVREGYCGMCHYYTSAPAWKLMKDALLNQQTAVFPAVYVDLTAGLDGGSTSTTRPQRSITDRKSDADR
jgi:hypothetical protein